MATATDVRPELESGDRLTRAEFHSRYCARPDIKRAELVQGVVYVASPVSVRHSGPHGLVVMWANVYAVKTPGVQCLDNTTVFLDAESEVQPDVCLFWQSPAGTKARITEDGYVEGAPDLVIEIAASSASYDLHDKKEAYRRAAVPEYVVWRVIDGKVDWFRLQNGEYVRVEPDAHGMIESVVFPGLRLPVARLLAGDGTAVLAALGIQA